MQLLEETPCKDIGDSSVLCNFISIIPFAAPVAGVGLPGAVAGCVSPPNRFSWSQVKVVESEYLRFGEQRCDISRLLLT